MSNNNKNALDKVDNILDKIENNKTFEARRIMQEREVQIGILSFLHDQLKRNSSKNKLNETLMEEIQSYFDDEEKRKKIGFVHLLKLMEIVNKTNNDLSLGIMNLISNKINKEYGNASPQTDINGSPIQDKEDNLSKEEVQKAKSRYQLFQKFEKTLDGANEVKKTEFTEDEN